MGFDANISSIDDAIDTNRRKTSCCNCVALRHWKAII